MIRMRGLGNDFKNWNVGLENHHLRSGCWTWRTGN
jgi:hypothetical protein